MTSPPTLPDELRERYQAERILGEGAFGVVVASRDVRAGRMVAIKLLRDPQASPDARARLLREGEAVARLAHPHVVGVHEFGPLAGGGAFVVYEFVRGEDLASVMARFRRLEPRRVAAYGAAIAQALAAAHGAGILHRDVKPENVLLRDGRHPLLADFGLARIGAQSSELTRTGMLMGTPAYMAPELWSGAPPSPASDQFAWAASLHQLLTGEGAFAGEDAPALAAAISRGERRPLPPDLSPAARALAAVLDRGLAHQPDQRYPDCAALAQALLQAARGTGRADSTEELDATSAAARAPRDPGHTSVLDAPPPAAAEAPKDPAHTSVLGAAALDQLPDPPPPGGAPQPPTRKAQDPRAAPAPSRADPGPGAAATPPNPSRSAAVPAFCSGLACGLLVALGVGRLSAPPPPTAPPTAAAAAAPASVDPPRAGAAATPLPDFLVDLPERLRRDMAEFDRVTYRPPAWRRTRRQLKSLAGYDAFRLQGGDPGALDPRALAVLRAAEAHLTTLGLPRVLTSGLELQASRVWARPDDVELFPKPAEPDLEVTGWAATACEAYAIFDLRFSGIKHQVRENRGLDGTTISVETFFSQGSDPLGLHLTKTFGQDQVALRVSTGLRPATEAWLAYLRATGKAIRSDPLVAPFVAYAALDRMEDYGTIYYAEVGEEDPWLWLGGRSDDPLLKAVAGSHLATTGSYRKFLLEDANLAPLKPEYEEDLRTGFRLLEESLEATPPEPTDDSPQARRDAAEAGRGTKALRFLALKTLIEIAVEDEGGPWIEVAHDTLGRHQGLLREPSSSAARLELLRQGACTLLRTPAPDPALVQLVQTELADFPMRGEWLAGEDDPEEIAKDQEKVTRQNRKIRRLLDGRLAGGDPAFSCREVF